MDQDEMVRKLVFSLALLVLGGAMVPGLVFGQVSAANRGLTIQLRGENAKDAPVVANLQLYTKSYALVIGINEYRNGWPRLSMAVNDAKAIAKELDARGFDVTLRTNPNSVQLKNAFEDFFVVKGADPAARLFVWFAGHGHTQGGEGFLIPADAPRPETGAAFKLSALPMRRFGEYVRLADAKHAYAVFDACFAGTVFNSQRSLPSVAITRATALPVRQFLTSGDADQTVSDDGAFRELFLRGLKGDEKADANSDGYVTASEMGLFLGDRMTNLTQAAQTPRYGKLRDKDYDRGDFVFRTTAPTEYVAPVQPEPVVVSAPTKRLTNSNWYVGLTATFQGTRFNQRRQRSTPIKTYFRYRDGLFEGKYVIRNRRGETHGKLGAFKSTGDRQGTFRWQDRRRSGTLRVTFGPHFKSFKGTWVPDRYPNGGGDWSGQR
jgi:hypothetical protein